MTVIYTDKLAKHGGFGSFFKLLLRWRGSVYKMVWIDMLIYLIMYYIISFIYRFGLAVNQKRSFESFVIHCARFRNLIPVSFVLGFFVSTVLSRWNDTYMLIPKPDTISILLATHIPGQDSESRKLRANVLRYINLSIAMTFARISPSVKKKLPTYNAYIEAGYLTKEEVLILESLEEQTTRHKTYVPLMWACKLIDKAGKDKILVSDLQQSALTAEILSIRKKCSDLMKTNEYNVPLVYTQVVTIAVYSFFLFSLIGEQFLDPKMNYSDFNIDFYVPVFALLQLFFYIGWLKVAEALLNPFGDDDHDFEFVPMLKKFLEVSKMLGEPSDKDLPSTIVNRLNLKYPNSDGDYTPSSNNTYILPN